MSIKYNETKISLLSIIDEIRQYPLVARLFGLILAFGGWTGLASVFPNELMPYPFETLGLAWSLVIQGTAFEHVASTLWLTILGFVGSLIVGAAIGILMGINNYGQRFFTPYVIIGLAIPAVAWAAVSTVIFGIGSMAAIIATVLVTFPFIAINVWKGVEGLEADLLKMSKSFNVSNKRILLRLILPSAAPSLFTALRFGLAISWKIVTVAEMFAASKGVGYMIIQSYSLYRFEEVWAWAALFTIIILFIEYGIFIPLERRIYDYRQDAEFDLIA